jgi:hypothetical protein
LLAHSAASAEVVASTRIKIALAFLRQSLEVAQDDRICRAIEVLP